MNYTENKFLETPRKKRYGKIICILLMVVFTLAMVADVVNYFITPAQNQDGFGPGGDISFSMPGDGEMPDFQMPEGNFENGEPPELPEGNGEMPAMEGRPDGAMGNPQGGFLQAARNAWLPILIACILGDGVCLWVLLRIRRKEKTFDHTFENVSGMPELPEDEDSDEAPKRKHGPWVVILCLAVAFGVILSMIPTGGDAQRSSVSVHQEVISGTAEAAQIRTTLSGAGTLEADNLTAVTVPQQVTVLKYHVRNGETVSAGDPLVSVDKTSASAAMMELNDILEDLDDDLETQRQKRNSPSITSTAAGRVKKIYAREGDTVTDVLYSNGALMLLSLDGTMKVTFASDLDLSVGDSVTVQYSGGSEEGRIASVRESTVTVTLSDEDAPYGAQATILDENGNAIGEGEIQINSELKVIGYYGTVDDINVDVGSKVSIGTTLMTLTDTGYTTDYQMLMVRRGELEEQMQQLSQLSQTGMVYAENDGIVSGVPDDAEIELLSNHTSANAQLLSDTSTSGGWQLILLSNFTPAEETVETTAPPETTVPPETTTPPETFTSLDDETPPEIIVPPETTIPPETTLPPETTEPSDPSDPSEPSTEPSDPSEPSEPEPSEPALNGTYAASLVMAGTDKLYVWMTPNALTGDLGTLDLSALKGQMTLFGEYPHSVSGDILLTENGETKTVTLSDLRQDDLLLLSLSDGTVTGILRAQRTSANQPGGGEGQMPGGNMPAGGGMASGGMSGMTSGGASGMTQQKSYDKYNTEQTELMYVSDQEEIALTISVDELDILSMESGMDAQVTLDAMKGQSFSGTIARIGNQGTTSDGNTKYSVTVTLPREAAMLDGMNASVKVVTETRDAAVAIPAAALVEEDGKTYVYTTYDEKTDALGGLQEVETGVSDGDLVEILSGLSVGDAFYYRYADTVTYSFLTRT